MTREEASFILANIDRRVCDDELNDALDMAITALEQEPCEDCISRAEAIENIKHAQLNFSVISEIDFTKYKREVQEIADGILNAQIKALSEMPSVQPKTGRWIHWADDRFDYCRCSSCGYGDEGEVELGNETPFCPMCGAKMEG